MGEFENINSLKANKEYFFVGSGRVSKKYIFEAINGHIFLMTDNGFLWEIDVENNICLGTIHYSKNYILDDFFVDEQYVWRICGNKKFGHRLSDRNRFMREYDYERCYFSEENTAVENNEKFKIYSNCDGWFQLKSGVQIKFFNNEDNYLCMIKNIGISR